MAVRANGAIGVMVRAERKRLGLRLQDLADRIYVAPSTLSEYERQVKPTPPEVVTRLVHAFGSPRFAFSYCYGCPANVLPVPPLDAVDEHPVVVLTQTVREFSEGEAALSLVDLVNRNRSEDLTETHRGVLLQAAEQAVDVLPAIQLFLTVLAERYGVPPWQLAARLYRKLRRRKYTTQDPPAAARFWPKEAWQ